MLVVLVDLEPYGLQMSARQLWENLQRPLMGGCVFGVEVEITYYSRRPKRANQPVALHAPRCKNSII